MHGPLEIMRTTQVKLTSNLQDQDVKEITKDQILFSSTVLTCASLPQFQVDVELLLLPGVHLNFNFKYFIIRGKMLT